VRDIREPEREERRSRTPVDFSGHKRLGTDDRQLDHVNYRYRWENDVGDMLSRMEEADWFRVTQAADTGENPDGRRVVSFTTKRRVGTDEAGQPMFAVLMGKRRDWFEQDTNVRIERGRLNMEAQTLPSDLEKAGNYYSAEASISHGFAEPRGDYQP
jgi:hypothetical protein